MTTKQKSVKNGILVQKLLHMLKEVVLRMTYVKSVMAGKSSNIIQSSIRLASVPVERIVADQIVDIIIQIKTKELAVGVTKRR